MRFPAIIVRRSAVNNKIATRIEQALIMRGVGLKTDADDTCENHMLHFCDILAGLEERGYPDDFIYRNIAGHLQNVWTEFRKAVNIKRTIESHDTAIRTLRQRLAVQSGTRKAAQ